MTRLRTISIMSDPSSRGFIFNLTGVTDIAGFSEISESSLSSVELHVKECNMYIGFNWKAAQTKYTN